MDAEQSRAKSIFLNAAEIAGAAEQEAYIAAQCGDDEALRREVVELLAHHAPAHAFLETPPLKLAATMEAPAAEGPGTIIGPYKLLQQIGEGGMGVVFMAEQTEPVRRKVALKIIKPGMDSRQVIARFEAERQALAMMDHVNIARVLDAGTIVRSDPIHGVASGDPMNGVTTNGRPYFVMELVHGVPITTYCDDNHLTPRERLELFVPVCQAIQHAHQKGIIHRDIKPSNVMVTPPSPPSQGGDRGGVPVPKVIDFGVAKAIDQRLTERTLVTGYGALVGTLEYMSPEQAEMSALGVDTRSDVYSLGVLIYELLTGTTPLSRERLRKASLSDLVRMIREEEAPRPSARLSSSDTLPKIAADRKTEPARLSKLMRGELDWIVMKALEKDRTRRYETASALARDVERYLADEPVEACPPSKAYQVRKFARKHRAGLATTAAFALLLIAGLFWYQGVQIDMATESARQTALQDARRQTVERDITVALDEAATIPAEVHRKLADPILFSELLSDIDGWKTTLDRARAAWKRADTLAAGNRDVLDPELLARSTSIAVDLEGDETDWRLAKELDDIRLEASTLIEGKFDPSKAGPKYAKFFGSQGLDFKDGQAAILSERIRSQRLRFVIVAALDNWATVTPPKKVLPAMPEAARLADPDPWRDQVRDPKIWQDKAALEKLALDVDFSRQSPHVLTLLGIRLDLRSQETAAFLRQALVFHPRDFWLNFELGRTTQDIGEQTGCYRAALATRPNSGPAYNNLGLAFWGKKDLEGAIRHFQKALVLAPNLIQAHNNLGIALRAKKDLEAALRHLNKVIELDAADASAHNNVGVALHDKKDLEGAIRHYKQAIILDSKLAAAHYNLGSALRDKKDLEGAIRHLEKAIELDSNFVHAHINLGNALRDKKDLQGAIRQYEKAIDLDPKNASAHAGLGDALTDKGDLQGAIRHYEEAIALDPNDATTYANLGNALQLRKDLAGAIRRYKQAIAIDSNLVLAHYNLGLALRAQGDLEGAIRHYKRAIDIDPNHGQAHNNLGAALYNAPHSKKDLDGAIHHFEKAIAINANNVEAYCNLGHAYKDKGSFDNALRMMKRAHTLGSKQPGWRYPTAQWVKDCEQLLALDRKLTAILDGKAQVEDFTEQLALADMCREHRMFFATAAGLYAIALAANPEQGDQDSSVLHRAAICAVRAAAGQGKDADKLDDQAKAKLRRQALDWLMADVTQGKNALSGFRSEKEALLVATALTNLGHCKSDPALASVGEEKELARLTVEEQKAWRQLWTDAADLANKARASFIETIHKETLTSTKLEVKHDLKLHAGQVVVIDMESQEFDAYVRLEDDKGKVLAENDDISPGNQNSRLVFTAPGAGAYRVVATSFEQGGRGAYTLTIRQFKGTLGRQYSEKSSR